MKVSLISVLLMLSICYCKNSIGQVKTLEEFLFAAQINSNQSKMIKINIEISRLQYEQFNNEYKPFLSFNGSIPGYYKQYYRVTQPDGRISFVPVKQNFSEVSFVLSKKIASTGGVLTIHSTLNRFDDLSTPSSQYNGTPVYLQISQPIFKVNDYKRKRVIEGLRLKLADQKARQEIGELNQISVELYFSILEQKINVEMLKNNLKHVESHLLIENGRIELGTTTKERILLLEMQKLTLMQSIRKSECDFEVAVINACSLLGFHDSTRFELIEPDQLPELEDSVLSSIKTGEFLSTGQTAALIEKHIANLELIQAKRNRFQINLNITAGFNGSDHSLHKIYNNAKDQQTLSVGLSIPIADWGRRKSTIQLADAREKYISLSANEQQRSTRIKAISVCENLLANRVNITNARTADSLSIQRYGLANELYKAGRIPLMELIYAQNDKDNARRNYLINLHEFWASFYFLKQLVLHTNSAH